MKKIIGNIYFEVDLDGYHNFGRKTRWGWIGKGNNIIDLNYFIKIFYRFYLITDYKEIAPDFV